MIAGPNGAGKTTAAPELLQGHFGIDDFINVDQLAAGLSGFDPESAAFRAGRILLERFDDLASQRRSFAFESTLSGLSLRNRFLILLDMGYEVHIAYLWLIDPDLAVARVKRRAQMGGHDVAEEDIRRRFRRSVLNFDRHYAPLVTSWRLHDAGFRCMPKIACCRRGEGTRIMDERLWESYRTAVEAQGNESSGDVMVRESREAFDSDEAAIDEALRRAWGRAVRRHRRLGFGLLVWEDGRIVDLDPWQVEIEEDPGEVADSTTYHLSGFEGRPLH